VAAVAGGASSPPRAGAAGGKGMPGEDYPWPWTVYRWLPGRSALLQPVADLRQEAAVLAAFVGALQAINTVGGPGSEFRGVPLSGVDRSVREAVTRLTGGDENDRPGKVRAMACLTLLLGVRLLGTCGPRLRGSR
jgi:aminoglycoside phosphotransferase (APT) family kinase protein